MTKCDRVKGVSKLVTNSVTYFMDGPIMVRTNSTAMATTQLKPGAIKFIVGLGTILGWVRVMYQMPSY